jgi:PAS domain S-box-containing protein
MQTENLGDNRKVTQSDGASFALSGVFDDWSQAVAVSRGDKVVYANRACADLYGFASPDDIMALESLLSLHPEHEHGRLLEYRHARAADELVPVTYELEALRRNHAHWWAEYRIKPVIWENEPAWLTAINDITERVLSERALREDEQRFRDFAQTSAVWLWETDREHRFVSLSGGPAHRSVEQTQEHLGGTRFDRRIEDDDDNEKWRQHQIDLEAHRPFRDFVYRTRGPDDHVRVFRTNGEPIFSATGAFCGYRGATVDITSFINVAESSNPETSGRLRRVESALQASETRAAQTQALLIDAIESLDVGFSMTGPDGRIVMTNQRYLDFYGELAYLFAPGASFESIARGMAASGLIPQAVGREDQWVRERVELHHNPGQPLEREYRPGHWFMASERKATDGSTFTVLSDITEIKRRELEISRLNLQLEERVAARTQELTEQLAATRTAQDALAASEQNLRSIMDNVIDGIIVLDAHGTILSFTSGAELVFGCAAAEVLGSSIAILLPEFQRQTPTQIHARLLELTTLSSQGANREIVGNRKDGTELPIDLGVSAVTRNGRTTFTGIARDVTERKRAEQELLEQSRMLETTLASISQGFALYDENERLVFCNNVFRDINNHNQDVIHPGTRFEDGLRSNLESSSYAYPGRTLDAQVAWRMERHRNPRGNIELRMNNGTWLLVTERKTDLGQTAHVVTDITDIKRSEEQRSVAQRRLIEAIESLPAAFVLYDADDKLVLCNEIFGDHFKPLVEHAVPGVDFFELAKINVESGWIVHVANAHEDWLTRRVAHHNNPDTNIEVTVADGRVLQLSERKTPDGDSVGLWFDITAQKRHEAELVSAREQADTANRAKSEFLSRMSHELRTPMNSVLGFAQLLELDERDPLSAAHRISVQEILNSGRHLLELINDILDLASIEAGKLAIDIRTIDVISVIESCLATTRPIAAQKEVRIFFIENAAELKPVRADETRMRQMLLNLLSNAIKYNHDGGEVTIRTERRGEGMQRIVVADNGPGIALDKQQDVFEPFSSSSNRNADAEGTGIGLTITRQLAELMHGRAGFSSTPGVGSEFWFELPIARR